MSAKNPMNSMWHKSKARPRAWWVGVVKEEKPTKKAVNPAAKNAAYKNVYNVRVGGYSVGLTFNGLEANSWIKASAPYLKPVVVKTPYQMPV